MTYDIHGTWDGNNPYTQAVVQAHTNLTEIDQALDLLWRNNINSNKVVLGLAFYGRSFTLEDTSCTAPGCPFSSGGNPGECTATSRILSDAEIQRLISQYDIVQTLDSDAAVKYMTWDTDQWVSYDDAQTFAMKVDYANRLCLGGTMVWALDLDSVANTTSINNLNSMNMLEFDAEVKAATVLVNAATLGIFWTSCLPPGSQECPPGYDPIVWGHGKVFDADLGHLTGEGCHGGGNGFNRVLCAPSNVRTVGCQWGPGRNGKSCNSKCPTGWLTLTKNSHIAAQKAGCKTGTYAPVCCQSVTATTNGWCYATNRDHVLSGSLAARDNVMEINSLFFDDSSSTDGTGVEPIAKRRSPESLARTGPKALAKRSNNNGCDGSPYLPLNAIPIDVPARLINSFIGNGQYLVSLSPTATPSPSTRRIRRTVTIRSTVVTTSYSTATRWCDGAQYPQPCHHYSSVAQYSTYQKPTCGANDHQEQKRPLVSLYDSTDSTTQHNSQWSKKWITKSYINPNGQRVGTRCQRDEWPPALFQQGRADGYIRLLPGSQNGGVPNARLSGWKDICKYPPDKQVQVQGGGIQTVGDVVYVTSITSSITTIGVMDYQFINMNAPQADPWLLTSNPCYPSILTQDPGFALLTWDPFYGGVGTPLPYSTTPTAQYPAGKKPPTKRDHSQPGEFEYPVFVVDESTGVIFVDEGNSTRRATDDEMLEHFGLVKCVEADCTKELEEYDQLVQQLKDANRFPSSADVSPTMVTAVVSLSESRVNSVIHGSRSDVHDAGSISAATPTSDIPLASLTMAPPSSQITGSPLDSEEQHIQRH